MEIPDVLARRMKDLGYLQAVLPSTLVAGLADLQKTGRLALANPENITRIPFAPVSLRIWSNGRNTPCAPPFKRSNPCRMLE